MTSIYITQPRKPSTKPKRSNSRTPNRRRRKGGTEPVAPPKLPPKPSLSQFGDTLLQQLECLSTIEDADESIEVHYFEEFLEGRASISSLFASTQRKPTPPSMLTDDDETAANTSTEVSFISQDNANGHFGGCLQGQFLCRKSSDNDIDDLVDHTGFEDQEYLKTDKADDDETDGRETSMTTVGTKDMNNINSNNKKKKSGWKMPMPTAVTNAWDNVISLPSNFQCWQGDGDSGTPTCATDYSSELSTPRHYASKDGNDGSSSKNHSKSKSGRENKNESEKSLLKQQQQVIVIKKDSSFCVDSLDDSFDDNNVEKGLSSSKEKKKESSASTKVTMEDPPVPTMSKAFHSRSQCSDGSPLQGRQLFGGTGKHHSSWGNDSQSTEATNNYSLSGAQQPYLNGMPIINDDDFHFSAEYLSEVDDDDNEEKVHKLAL